MSTITLPRRDVRAGVSHDDDYRMSNGDFRAHLAEMFLSWHERDEVVSGQWPATLEEAWGIEVRHDYPLSPDAAAPCPNPARTTRWNSFSATAPTPTAWPK